MATEGGSHLWKVQQSSRALPDRQRRGGSCSAISKMTGTAANGNSRAHLNQDGLKSEDIKKNGYHNKREVRLSDAGFSYRSHVIGRSARRDAGFNTHLCFTASFYISFIGGSLPESTPVT